MDSTFVWIILFSGAAIALLAVFLVASEKELKKKRLEIDQLLARVGDAPVAEGAEASVTAPAAYNPELDQLRARNQELERELAAVSSGLESGASASGELELAQRNVEIAKANAQWLQNKNEELTAEVEELKARLAASADRSEESVGAREQELLHEVAELRTLLAESRTPVRESDSGEETSRLENRIADLESELSGLRNAHADDLQALRARLADSERVQQALREERRKLEEDLAQLQTQARELEERNRRIEALREPFGELLARHSSLEEKQREYGAALAGFAQLIAKTDDTSPAVGGFNRLQSAPLAAASSFRYESESAGEVSPEQIIAAAESTETPRRRMGALPLVLALALGGTMMVALWSMQGSDTPSANALSVAKREAASTPAPLPMPLPEPARIEPEPVAPLEKAQPAAEEARPAANEKTRRLKTTDVARAQQAVPGTYEITRATRVYAAPSELSHQMGDIEPGVRVNVVNSKDGWLEIHSKHGRPPGFIRREGARVLAQN